MGWDDLGNWIMYAIGALLVWAVIANVLGVLGVLEPSGATTECVGRFDGSIVCFQK